jgi:large subunit ribosomal protein L25
MSDVTSISAEVRERAGKGAARATRRSGMVPGVIYGSKKDPAMISLQAKELIRHMSTSGFFARLYDVELGKGKERVLARDVQLDPVTDHPIHIDFLRVSATTTVTVAVPVVFINEEDCPGLTMGGVLNVVRYEIDLVCRADAIPQQLEVDLTGLEFGDGAHISNVKLPDGVEPTITDRDFTIVTIAAPVAEVEEVEEDAEDLVEGEEAEAATEEAGEEAAAESSKES